MKKILFVTAAVVSLVFSGCIKEDDSYKKLRPVQKGIDIYTWAMNQNIISMEQANIGMRMAMLVAEAEKQGVENFDDVKVDKVSVKSRLLGTSSKIERTTTGYKITFNPAYADLDRYTREGVVLINTHEAPLLEGTVGGKNWTVTFENGLKLGTTSSDAQVITLSGGLTEIYNEGAAYAISLANQTSYLSGGAKFQSNWGGRFTVKPENMNFTYSDCAGETFLVNGTAYGDTFYTMDGASPLQMSIGLTGMKYLSPSRIESGKVNALLTGNYDMATYPISNVTVEWSVDANGKLRQTITYGENTVTI